MRNHSYENVERRLVLKWRQKVTWKWPIADVCIDYGVQSRKPMLISIKASFTVAFKEIEKCGRSVLLMVQIHLV